MIPKFISHPDPSVYLRGSFLALDIETTNLDKGNAVNTANRIVCWAAIKGNVHNNAEYYYSHSDTELIDLVEDHDYDFILVHGGKFELKYFIRLGIKVDKLLVYDTLLSEKVIASNRKWPLGLGQVHKRYGGAGKAPLVDVLIKGGVCPSEIPESLLKERVVQDVLDTIYVYKKQVLELEAQGILGVAYTKNLFSPVVADMEMNGMYLDRELVTDIATRDNREHLSILTRLDAITGGINLASSVQRREFIYGELGFDVPKRYGRECRTPANEPSTAEDVLLLLKAKNKRQRTFLELISKESKLRKRITTYHKLFVTACEKNDNYIHGSINQEIANTQRLTSSAPNLQNIDRKLKKVVTARNEGWRIRQNDYSQLEFRVAGFSAQCEVTLKSIQDKRDVHSDTAYAISDGYDHELKHTPEMSALRTDAKSRTFKPLYGGESGTDREVAYFNWFKQHYSGINEWHRNLMDEAVSNGTVTTITGLKFYFPNTRRLRSGNVTNHTMIKNYSVQYLATGEIAIIGTLLLWHNMKSAGLESFLINEVHDSAIIEEHPLEGDIMEELSHTAMVDDTIKYLKDVYGINFNFPLEIETEVNSNWGYDK